MSHVKPVGGVFEFQDFGAGTLGVCKERAEASVGTAEVRGKEQRGRR